MVQTVVQSVELATRKLLKTHMAFVITSAKLGVVQSSVVPDNAKDTYIFGSFKQNESLLFFLYK